MNGKIIVVGLGPGNFGSLSLDGLQKLKEASCLYVRTALHPLISELEKQGIKFKSFDFLYEEANVFEEVYEKIAQSLIDKAKEGETVTFAVPGHPFVAEETIRLLKGKGKQEGIEVEVVTGMSFLDCLFTALGLDPLCGIKVIDALQMDKQQADPAVGNILVQVYNQIVASEAKIALLEVYPPEFLLKVVRAAGVPGEERIEEIPLFELDRLKWLDYLTTVYLPPAPELAQKSNFPMDPIVEVMEKLRGENGCPWDREQTHQSLKPYLLEETHEVLEAIDDGDMYKMAEELGDLLLQVIFHAQIAKENGAFDINDVVSAITEKMIHRHPHVFGDKVVKNSAEVLENWDKIKATERNGLDESILDSIPKGLPALLYAEKLQRKAAKVGFDWTEINAAWSKVYEEIREFEAACTNLSKEKRIEEFGDIIFALVNIARMLNIPAEVALQKTNTKFRRRFQYIEKRVREEGGSLEKMSLEEMDRLWEEAKVNLPEEENRNSCE